MQPYQGPQPEKIRAMFSEIAGNYDRANQILSVGIHHLWRKAVVRMSGAVAGMKVLDCATGTGDLAIEFARAVMPLGASPVGAKVVGTDFCAEMLEPASGKAARAGFPSIDFSQADVMNLPFADNSFDVASISFGIRNVADPVRALAELRRVVKPGGVVMILEFGQPNVPGVGGLYRFYSNKVLPKIGGLITGKPQAYEYLQNSSANFPCRDGFLALIDSAGGFASREFKPVSMGIAYIYKAVKA